MGHYDKCCMTYQDPEPPKDVERPNTETEPRLDCRRVGAEPAKSPPPVLIRVRHAHGSSRLLMLPDTGTAMTIIGRSHLHDLGIPASRLQPATGGAVFMADGSRMAPPVGTFEATLTLRGRSCVAKICVQDGVPMPLLSYEHCLHLAIIPPGFPNPLQSGIHTQKPSGMPTSSPTPDGAAFRRRTSTAHANAPRQAPQPALQREPHCDEDHPTRPFEDVSVDFLQVAGTDFLIIADRLSGWPVVVPCTPGATAQALCRAMCNFFRAVGTPSRLRSDGGTQLAQAEVQDYLTRWGVTHITSTPLHPSNEPAAAAVRSVKHLLLQAASTGQVDVARLDQGLLELRNSPNSTGRSPAQTLFGQNLRSRVPAHSKSFLPEWQEKAEAYDRRTAAHDPAVHHEDDQHACIRPQLHVGQRVYIQDTTTRRWDKVGVVMGIGRTRDYNIRLPSGRVWWRNGQLLRPAPPPGEAPVGPPVPPPLQTRPRRDRSEPAHGPSAPPRRPRRRRARDLRSCAPKVG